MREHDCFRFDGTEYDPTQIRDNLERNRIATDGGLHYYTNRTLEVVFDELVLPVNYNDTGQRYPIVCRIPGIQLDRELYFETYHDEPGGYVYVFDERGEQVAVERGDEK